MAFNQNHHHRDIVMVTFRTYRQKRQARTAPSSRARIPGSNQDFVEPFGSVL